MSDQPTAADGIAAMWGWAIRENTGLPMFTVYNRPKDAPDRVIVRLFLNDRPTPHAWQFDSVDAARVPLLDIGLIPIPRADEDEAPIVETWF